MVSRRFLLLLARNQRLEAPHQLEGEKMTDLQAGLSGPSGGLSRRQFLKLLGAVGGSGMVMNTMTAWGMFQASAQTEPPKLEGSGNGTKVLILGGGPGGCPSAYELMNLGYDVTVLEAKDHLGGHAFTVRMGSTSHEYGGEEQTCTWDEGLWFDAGPSRIPFYHRGVLHYCKEFNIPMIDHKNLDLNGWVYVEGIDGALNGQKMRLHELEADMAGYISELLAKAANQGALDQPYTAEDHDNLIDYLVNWGMISSSDLTYTGSDRRGYVVYPDTQTPGEIGPPYPWPDLLPFAESALAWNGGYLSAAATFDWQTTLQKPVNGVGQLFTEGFAGALGERVKLNAEVAEIHQDEDQVTVIYTDKATGQSQQISADYCFCNIPLSVLIKLKGDWSSDMRTAMMGVPYDMAGRMGMAFKRRFWEEDDWIYGGQSFTNVGKIGIIGYPDSGYHTQKGVLLGYYNFDTDAAEVSAMSLADRTELALQYGSKIHPTYREDFESSFSVAWHRMPYSLGAWPNYWTNNNRAMYFSRLQQPDGRIYLVGEHLSYVNAWMEGAVQAAWMQVEALHKRVMGGA
jgi:monoamine oxidase